MCVREACVRPCKLIEIFGMINPLQTTKSGRGIVSVRVALLLRFTEIKPCSYDLFRLYLFLIYDMNSSPLSILSSTSAPPHTFHHIHPFLFCFNKVRGSILWRSCVWCRVFFYASKALGFERRVCEWVVWCCFWVVQEFETNTRSYVRASFLISSDSQAAEASTCTSLS